MRIVINSYRNQYNYINMKIILILLLILIIINNVYSTVKCIDDGLCMTCNKDEMDSDYCKDTGRKMKTLCYDKGTKFDDWRACLVTVEDDQIRVIMFQALMGIIGGLAYWGVQVRKQAQMSLFETRKYNSRQRNVF